jgi:hypothetical protein
MKSSAQSDIKTDFAFPSPVEPNYCSRMLVHPPEKRKEVSDVDYGAAASVIWTRMEQNMFDLQAKAAENETHERKGGFLEDPYPQ